MSELDYPSRVTPMTADDDHRPLQTEVRANMSGTSQELVSDLGSSPSLVPRLLLDEPMCFPVVNSSFFGSITLMTYNTSAVKWALG
jgi:hypothetical protein